MTNNGVNNCNPYLCDLCCSVIPHNSLLPGAPLRCSTCVSVSCQQLPILPDADAEAPGARVELPLTARKLEGFRDSIGLFVGN